MNTERMLDLADRLEKLPNRKFHMDYWFSKYVEDKDSFFLEEYSSYSLATDHGVFFGITPDKIVQCQTAACVAGWACIFYLGYDQTKELNSFEIGTRAAGLLALETPGELFQDYSLITPAEAAAKIRTMVREYEDGKRQTKEDVMRMR